MKFWLILFQMFYIPFENTFLHYENPFDSVGYILYVTFLILLSLIDIILTFNIGVYIEGHIINNRKEIAWLYMKSNFILDFLGFFIGFVYR